MSKAKKHLSILLSVLMILSVLPLAGITAFAGGAPCMSGTYEERKMPFATLAEVLATVNDFPTDSSGNWINAVNSKAYIENADTLIIVDGKDSRFSTAMPVSISVTPDGDNYVYDGSFTNITFVMENGVLQSFIVSDFYNGNLSGIFAPHTHAFADSLTADANGHWHACTSEDCPISDYSTCSIADAAYAAHTGMNDFTCDICGYYDEAGALTAALAAAKEAAKAAIDAELLDTDSDEIKAAADEAKAAIDAAETPDEVESIKIDAVKAIRKARGNTVKPEPCEENISSICEVYNRYIDVPVLNVIFSVVHSIVHVVYRIFKR